MHIFYNIKKLPFETIKEIIKEAYSKQYKWRVDKLDCNISWRREEIKMSFKEIMKKAEKDSHFVFIHRDDILVGKYLEIGFSTRNEPSYFLWLFLDEKEIPKFVEKYGLKKI